MTWGDAAEKVLRTENRPLHYADFARKIIQQKLTHTKGRARKHSFYASISSDDKERRKKGRPPRFAVTNGIVRLTEWRKGRRKADIYGHAESHRDQTKKRLLGLLCQLDGVEFEEYLEELLVKIGYDNIVPRGRRRKHDKGIDLFCELKYGINRIKTAVQAKCKKTHNKIGPKDIYYLRECTLRDKCSQGVFITTSSFTRDAKAAAREQGMLPIRLIDGDELVDLALEHEVGATTQMIKTYEIDENFFLFRSSSRCKPR